MGCFTLWGGIKKILEICFEWVYINAILIYLPLFKLNFSWFQLSTFVETL